MKTKTRKTALVVDLGRHLVMDKGREVELAPKAFKLLVRLAKAKRHVVTRDQLVQDVWPHAVGLDLNTRTIDQHVARLRRAFGRTVIRTIAGTGYAIGAAVKLEGAAA